MTSRWQEEPVATPTDEDEIAQLVIDDILKRREVGLKKYGKALWAQDGTDYLQHLYEEILDAAHYLKGMLAER